MYKLCVTAKKLNIRNSPEMDPGLKNRIGETIFGEKVQATRKIGDWYADDSNRFYWAGGLMDITACQPWMIDLRLPEIWQFATGKGVGVAVVDTGIVHGNPDLIFDSKSYFAFDGSANITDSYGHGTNCAGLIGARNKQGEFIGVAPECNLYVCKIAEKGHFTADTDTRRYAEAISWCANQPDIHIISISWSDFIMDKQILDSIQTAIDLAVSKNKIIVCAIGDAGIFNDNEIQYPAGCGQTIVTGSIPEVGKVHSYINPFMTSALKGADILSYGVQEGTKNMSGSSQSNAILAGILALLVQKTKGQLNARDIKQKIAAVSPAKTFTEKVKQDNGTVQDVSVQIPVLDGNLLLSLFKS